MAVQARSRSKRKKSTGGLTLALAVLAVLAVASPAAALVAVCGLLPTIVVILFDATYAKTTACAVGGMNLAGVFPFLPPLLLSGRNGSAAFDVFHDIVALIAMYGAAACGWLLVALLPLTLHAMDVVQDSRTITRLRQQQTRLTEAWGPEVNGREL